MGICETCRFWHEHSYGNQARLGHGWCRRNAPSAVINPDLSGDHWPEAYWPATTPGDWCGEHQHRIPTHQEPAF